MKIIEAECPGAIDLGYRFIRNKENNFDLCKTRDLISFKDKVEVFLSKKNHHHIIEFIPNKLSNIYGEYLLNLTGAFFDYYNIKYCKAVINVFSKMPTNCGLGEVYSWSAGIILSLNTLLNLNLSIEDLAKFALKINYNILFYLYGGCHTISDKGDIINDKKIYTNSYVIIRPKVYNNSKIGYNEETLQKLKEIREILRNKKSLVTITNPFYPVVTGGFKTHHESYLARQEFINSDNNVYIENSNKVGIKLFSKSF